MGTILLFSLVFSVLSFSCSLVGNNDRLEPYIATLEERGEDPVTFVLNELNQYDLILFDDALHTALEPFEFYQKLITEPGFQKKVRYIFLEAASINQQPALDAYFEAETEDLTLLYPVFQNDFSGFGWRYKSYFDLLQTVRVVNASLPPEDRLKVIAVNAPTYWMEIKTPKDVELFRLSITGNDYVMYKTMLSYLGDFKSGEKGIFLTNTRHAYKGIKNHENDFYWNCGTFFHQWHSGKTYSVRFHNINLHFEKKKEPEPDQPKTTEGLEDKVIKWVRMENGLWDSAFKAMGDVSVAFDLKATPFGRAKYVGNHMLDVAAGQTFYDAYDALIFLAPIDKSRQTGMVDFLYTEQFKAELERRIKFLLTEQQTVDYLNNSGAKSIREFIDKTFVNQNATLQPMLNSVGPIDAWKTAKE